MGVRSLLLFLCLATCSLLVVSQESSSSSSSSSISGCKNLRCGRVARRLQGDSEDGGDYQNNYEGNNNGDGVWTAAEQRVEQDLSEMWNVPPSQWITEYWEILGVAALIVFSMLLCLCGACCFPVQVQVQVQGHDDGEELPVRTPEEHKAAVQAQKATLAKEAAAAVAGTPLLEGQATEEAAAETTDKPNLQIVLENKSGALSEATTQGTQSPQNTVQTADFIENGRRTNKKETPTLMGEIVSVWQEYLTGKPPETEFIKQPYERFNDSGERDPRSDRMPPRRKSRGKRDQESGTQRNKEGVMS